MAIVLGVPNFRISTVTSKKSSCGDGHAQRGHPMPNSTVKILKFGTPQTIAILVLKIEKFEVTLH